MAITDNYRGKPDDQFRIIGHQLDDMERKIAAMQTKQDEILRLLQQIARSR